MSDKWVVVELDVFVRVESIWFWCC